MLKVSANSAVARGIIPRNLSFKLNFGPRDKSIIPRYNTNNARILTINSCK